MQGNEIQLQAMCPSRKWRLQRLCQEIRRQGVNQDHNYDAAHARVHGVSVAEQIWFDTICFDQFGLM